MARKPRVHWSLSFLSVSLGVVKLLLNACTDFDEIVCVCLSGSLNGLDSQLDQVGSTGGGARTGILRFKIQIFIYKWLLLVIGVIISRN